MCLFSSLKFESVLTTSMSKKEDYFYWFFGVPETSEFTKPPGTYEFCGFAFQKNQEGASKFGSILGHGRGLVNNCSAVAGRAPNRTGRTLNSSFPNCHKRTPFQEFKARFLQCGWWPWSSQILILNLLWILGWIFSFVLFQRKSPQNPPENPPQIHPEISSAKFLGFLQKPFLDTKLWHVIDLVCGYV